MEYILAFPFKNDIMLFCTLTADNTHIENSYRVKSRSDMKEVISRIRTALPPGEYAINRLSVRSMVREWRAHNLLYALGLWRERTRSVDLNENTWPVRACYFVLSCLYFKK